MTVKIILVCGGRGSRLSPITDSIPKHLIWIKNKVLLNWHLDNLKEFTDIVLATGYKQELIQKFVTEHPEKNRLSTYKLSYEKLKTLPGPWYQSIKIAKETKSNHIIVWMADVFLDKKITSQMIQKLGNYDFAMLTAPSKKKGIRGVLQSTHNTRVVKYIENDVEIGDYVNIGVYFINRLSPNFHLFDTDFNEHKINQMISKGLVVKHIKTNSFHHNINTKKDLKILKKFIE